jgi:hypothetical protein
VFFAEPDAGKLSFFNEVVPLGAQSNRELLEYLKRGGFVAPTAAEQSPGGKCRAVVSQGSCNHRSDASHANARKVLVMAPFGKERQSRALSDGAADPPLYKLPTSARKRRSARGSMR